MLTITKEFRFEAAHRLPVYDGLCNRIHGHSYRLQVGIIGEIQEAPPKTGMIMDFGDLKKAVNEKVIDKLDHQYLNEVFPFMTPTAEMLVLWIIGVLEQILPGLVRIRLYETETSFCEWTK